jgi:hypothetical protein
VGVGAARPSVVTASQHAAVPSSGTDAWIGRMMPASSTSWDDVAPSEPAVLITLERDDGDAGHGVGLHVGLAEAIVIRCRGRSCVGERHHDGRRGERAEICRAGPGSEVRHG